MYRSVQAVTCLSMFLVSIGSQLCVLSSSFSLFQFACLYRKTFLGMIWDCACVGIGIMHRDYACVVGGTMHMLVGNNACFVWGLCMF